MRRWVRISAGVFVTTVVAAGVIAYTSLLSPPVATTYYVSPTGSDSGSCTQGAPCLSFNYPFSLASAPVTVEIASGSYGAQTIAKNAAVTTCCVTFKPASGASVTLSGSLHIQANYVKFVGTESPTDLATLPTTSIPRHGFDFSSGFEIGDSTASAAQPTQVTLDAINSAGQSGIVGTYNSLINSNVSGGAGSEDILTTGTYNNFATNHLTITGNVIHDSVSTGLGHQDNFAPNSLDDVTFSRNKLTGCISTCMFFKTDCCATPSSHANATIENNSFQSSVTDPFLVQITKDSGASPLCTNFVVRYNTFVGGSALFNCTDAANATQLQVYGNIVLSGGLCTLATWKYNYILQGGTTCDATDFVATVANASIFVNPVTTSSGDWHLIAGSEARAKGDPTRCPINDVELDARPNPAGTTCDAGYDERS